MCRHERDSGRLARGPGPLKCLQQPIKQAGQRGSALLSLLLVELTELQDDGEQLCHAPRPLGQEQHHFLELNAISNNAKKIILQKKLYDMIVIVIHLRSNCTSCMNITLCEMVIDNG